MIELSRRLHKAAEQVPPGSRLADIGSDHALLPVFLAEQGKITYGIAGELNAGPLAAADKQVREAGLQNVIQVRQGNGLSVVSAGEVDVVTIAGMGGSLISRILSEGESKLRGVARIVLQPNVGEDMVRRWLVRHDWFLSNEHLVEEDGKIYEIITADRVPDAVALNRELFRERTFHGIPLSSEWLFTFGPYLLDQGGSVFKRKWDEEIKKLRMIIGQLSRSKQESAMEKRFALLEEISIIEEVLACLQTDKPLSP